MTGATLAVEEEEILDDPSLLADRLLRSLHRNKDGHLAESNKVHMRAIEDTHNVCVLQVYLQEDDSYSLYEHYVYSEKRRSYTSWALFARKAAMELLQSAPHIYGVYGWSTVRLPFTPLRTGDMFVTVDDYGARGVRLTFDSAARNRKARRETKNKA